MTEIQARKKCRALLRFQKADIYEKIDRAISCGAIDFEKWPDDYRLPKAIITAVFYSMAEQQVANRFCDTKRIIGNLRRFV